MLSRVKVLSLTVRVVDGNLTVYHYIVGGMGSSGVDDLFSLFHSTRTLMITAINIRMTPLQKNPKTTHWFAD